MLHNESLNVWSHLLGAIMFVCFFIYVVFNMQPSSLHSLSLTQRWRDGFDTGRFDILQCDRPDFVFPQPDQCPYPVEELLDDLLETEQLLNW